MRSIRLLAAATFILVLGSGCGSDGGGVEPGNDPVAEFTVAACTANTACAFTDASTDPDGNQTITARVWDFGDPASGTANASTETNPSHTFAAANTYNVKLTVTDNSGKTSVKTNPVVVTAATGTPPVASFDLPTDCTAGTPCGFHSTSTDDGTIEAALWEFGDTETAEGADATHTFAAPGTYGVKLTVTDNQGNPGSVTQQVVVSPAASQDCTSSGTAVDCSLTVSQRSTLKFTVVSRNCQLSGNSLGVTSPRADNIFFNLCNRAVGDEEFLRDNANAPLVIEAGTVVTIRFVQGTKGLADPPTGDPGIQISGSTGNWTLHIDDGGAAGTPGEPDFDDAVISVTTIAAP